MSGSFLILTRIAERGCRFLNEILKSCEECASPPVLLRRGHSGGAYYQVLLGFPGMAPQSKKKTNSCKTKKLQNNKNMTRPDCLPLLPSIGVCNLVFCCFLFFAFPRIFGRKPNTKKQKTQETKYAAQLSADAPPWGVQSCFFFCFFWFSKNFCKTQKRQNK